MKKIDISIVVPTYNSSKTLEALLKSIREQDYDKKKIEIILADGGSTDTTEKLAKKYNAIFLSVTPKEFQAAEYNRGYGSKHAKGDILAFFDHDNVLPHSRLLKVMMQPLNENMGIVAVETLYYHYNRSMSTLDRYFALLGVNDPLPFYLGKSDRQSYIYKDGYHLMGKAIDKGDYYVVKFDKDNIPTLGSNGFLIRRKLLMRHANVSLDKFFHIDVNVDLIRKGYNTYAFVKDSVTHLSNHNDFIAFLWRRRLYMKQYHVLQNKSRRYSVYEKKNLGKLLLFIFFSLTFIKPFFDAFRGFIVKRDFAWFLHPFMCIGTVIVYGYTFITVPRPKNE